MSDRATVVRIDKSGDTVTATANGTGYLCSRYNKADVYINVASVTGTSPTLDVTIQTSADNSNWHAHTAMSQITDSTLVADAQIEGIGEYIRLVYTLGGTTPSFDITAKIVLKT